MQLSLTPDEALLRDEVRAFLVANMPAADEVPEPLDERMDFLRAWQRRLHEAGLVGLTWPREYGGRGATLMEKIIVQQELAAAGAPETIGSIGLEVVGPSIIDYGTPEQKAARVSRILSAEDIWCQGFSETESGSDLASLRTKATDEGDHFLLNGQKTWTSFAQYARWCAVLARTDADAPAHRGISYLIVDLRSPGVQARPLQLSTGDAEFGEVFFDDVQVPKENLLGPLHGGWGIAMHTLSHERGPYAMARQGLLRAALDRAVAEAASSGADGSAAIDDPVLRSTLARAHVGVEILRHECYMSVGRSMAAGGHPGFESSVDKVVLGQVEQEVAAAALDVQGPLATTGGDLERPWQHLYLYGRAGSVYGGTAQIQKNIIAERILGLPRSK